MQKLSIKKDNNLTFKDGCETCCVPLVGNTAGFLLLFFILF